MRQMAASIIIIIIISISRLSERPQKSIELVTIKQKNSRKKIVGTELTTGTTE